MCNNRSILKRHCSMLWELGCFSGQWSACFLNNNVESCGQGSQIRNVYCLSSLDEAVLDEFCTDLHGAAPLTSHPCLVPCADQCELSEWSDWTQCTATCGPQGGTQTRTRQITGERSTWWIIQAMSEGLLIGNVFRPCPLFFLSSSE